MHSIWYSLYLVNIAVIVSIAQFLAVKIYFRRLWNTKASSYIYALRTKYILYFFCCFISALLPFHQITFCSYLMRPLQWLKQSLQIPCRRPLNGIVHCNTIEAGSSMAVTIYSSLVPGAHAGDEATDIPACAPGTRHLLYYNLIIDSRVSLYDL